MDTRTENTPPKGRDWDTTLPFSSDRTLCPFHDAHKNPLFLSRVSQRNGIEALLWSSVRQRGFPPPGKSADQMRTVTLNEGKKKYIQFHKKKNRNNKEQERESKITWTWVSEFEIRCIFLNLKLTPICSWNSCSLQSLRLLWEVLTSLSMYMHLCTYITPSVWDSRFECKCRKCCVSLYRVFCCSYSGHYHYYYYDSIMDPFHRLWCNVFTVINIVKLAKCLYFYFKNMYFIILP